MSSRLLRIVVFVVALMGRKRLDVPGKKGKRSHDPRSDPSSASGVQLDEGQGPSELKEEDDATSDFQQLVWDLPLVLARDYSRLYCYY